jgi:hypothetical protein
VYSLTALYDDKYVFKFLSISLLIYKDSGNFS